MTPELYALALAILLQAAQLVVFAIPANLELGSRYTAGTRDAPPERPLSPRTGRLQRAVQNHFEALILFTAAVVVVTLSDRSSWVTAACAFTYLGARLLYVPAYVRGWVPWRSVIWGVGFAATLLMILAALL